MAVCEQAEARRLTVGLNEDAQKTRYDGKIYLLNYGLVLNNVNTIANRRRTT